MSFFNKIFGKSYIPKKEPSGHIQPITIPLKPAESQQQLTVQGVKDVPKKTIKQQFDEWYSSLSPEDKRKFDQKMEKLYFKTGTTIACFKCGKPGGKYNNKGYTLRKVENEENRYEHVGACPED